MTVRFHPPQDQSAYADRVLAVLLQAAMPQAAAQLARISREEPRKFSGKGMSG